MSDNRTRGQTAVDYMDAALTLLGAAKRAFPEHAITLAVDGPLSPKERKAQAALDKLESVAWNARRLCWEAWEDKT